MSKVCRGLSAALLSCVLAIPLGAAAHAQSGAASMAWGKFTATNSGWSAEWSAAGDQAESVSGLSAPSSRDPAAIAMSFITANSAILGIAGGTNNLKLDHRIFDGTDTHVSYQQIVGGRPVFNGFVDVHVNGNGQVYLVNNTAVSPASAASLSPMPVMSGAVAAAAAQGVRHTFHDKRGLPYTLVLKPVGEPQLGIQKTEAGSRLAYRVDLGAVVLVIDANTGAVLDTIEREHSVNGTGTAFDPNPVNFLNEAALNDRNDTNYAALQGAYLNKALLGITKTGTGANTRYSLVGPFVKTGNASAARLAECGRPVLPGHLVAKPPAKSKTGKFPVNRSMPTFEHVMVYFHLDRSARYIHSIGFPTLWNTPIRVDAHAITDDNSGYCGVPTGAGYLKFGDGGVDDAEDADVILHEFGHAIQDAASNGRFNGQQADAMGEGFGDYWAFSGKPAGVWAPCFAEWDSEGHCLRRLDRNKKFPRDYVGREHEDGEIWSRALRDLFTAVGKNKADRIILKSHYLVPNNPNFSKGLSALVAADKALFAGANKHAVCAAFIERGISATECGYWVHLTWNTLGADVDLHIVPPAPLTEVSFTDKHPNWGDQTTDEDDPTLYQDCTSTCTSEEITVASLPTPGTYRVFARYYSDHGKGPTTASIEIFRGATRLFNGSQGLAATGAEWTAFNIVIPAATAASGSEPQIVEVNQVVPRAGPSAAK